MSTRFRLFLFTGLACWLLLCVYFYLREYNHNREFVFELAKNEAQSNFSKDMAYRRWASSHGGVYVPIDSITPPNPYLKDIPEQNLTTPSGRKLTLVNPAYMTRQVHEVAEKQYGVKGHITSLNPIRPANKPDDWEAKMLKVFESGLMDTVELVEVGGKTHIRYMRAMITEPSCMKCHALQGYKVGQVRGGISVSIPWEKYSSILQHRSKELNIFYSILFILTTVFSFVGYTYINHNQLSKKSAEELLIKSESRFRSIITVSHTGAWEFNRKINYLWCSPEYFTMLGLAPEDYVKHGSANLEEVWVQLLHPEDREEAMKCLFSYLRNGSIGLYENYFRMKKADGSWAWILSRGQTLRNPDGTLSDFTLGTHIDITQRILAEKELEELNRNLLEAKNKAEEKERNLSEYQNIAKLGGWELDISTGTFTFNDNFYRIFHTSVEQMGGYHVSIDDYARLFVHPDDASLVAEETQKAIASDNPDFSGYIEHKIQYFDGGIGYIGVKYFIIKDNNGNTIKTYGVNQDITEKKLAEQVIIHTKALLDTAFEQTPIPMLLVSMPDMTIRYINKPSLEFFEITDEPSRVGNSIENLVRSWQEYHSDGKPLSTEDTPLARVMRGESVLNEEYFIVTKNGSKKWELVSGAPVYNPNGEIIAAYIIFPDISEQKQIEEELKASEKRYEQIDSSSRDSIYAYDRNERFTHANRSLCSLLGVSREEIIGKTHEELGFPKAQCEEWQRLHDEVYATGTTVIRETETPIQNGEVMYFEVILNPIYESSGEIIGISGVTRNITDRKRAEQKLKENERLLRMVLDNSRDGINMLDLHTGRYIFMNNAQENLTGFTRDELMQLSAEAALERVHPEDRSISVEHQKRIGGGEDCDEIVEYRWKVKSGEYRWFSDRRKLVRDESGNPSALVGISRDITDRKLAEDALRENEERFRIVFEKSAVAKSITGLNGKLLQVNQAFADLLGYSITEIERMNFSELTHPDDIEGSRTAMQQILDGKKSVVRFEKRYLHRDGAVIWAEANLAIARDSSSMPMYFLASIVDITSRKAAEAELLRAKEKAEEANIIKSNFFANMSHELRTPMIGILGYSELLMDNSDEEVKRSAEIIYRGGKRLMDTLNLILNMSKIEAGKVSSSITVVDAGAILRETTLAFKQAASKKSLTLDLAFSQEPVCIQTDAGMLQQILNNLINNAIKYTDKGGVSIKVNKSYRDGLNGFEFIVKDTGMGIDPKNHDIIFEEFRQVSEGKGRSFEGTGLGLSITKRFVEKLGGTIAVKSALGEGAEFTVWLPGALELPSTMGPANQAADKKVIVNTPPKENKPCILYVDDDPVAISLAKLLMKEFCEIESAQNSEQAIAKAKAKVYRAVLMDINLGKGPDGIETTKIIRTLPEYMEIPIIALTAYAAENDKNEFILSGCSHYLSKPYNFEDLKSLLEEVLA